MLGLEETVRWAAAEARWLVGVRGLMFAWNLVLAAVPLALALVLFRPSARRTARWWGGVAAFVLFLPNAAYVLTDVVHLLHDIRSGPSDLALVTVYAPAYGLFMALGFSCYVLSLMRLQRYLHAVAPRWRWWPVETALHVLAAVGIFLGRVLRFNSWDVISAPGDLTDSLPLLATRFPVLFVGFTFVVLVTLTAIAKPALRIAAGRVSSLGQWVHRRWLPDPPVGMA